MPKPPKRAAKKSAVPAKRKSAQMELPVHTDAAGIAAGKAGGKKLAAGKTGKASVKKAGPKNPAKAGEAKNAAPKKAVVRKTVHRAVRSGSAALRTATLDGATAGVLDRLFEVVTLRRDADPNISHSARLLSRGTAKVAQKFGEEAVECLIEAVAGNSAKLIGESADVLYHLIVMWVDVGVHPGEIWAELQRREGTSGIAEKLGRATRPAGE